MKWYECKGNDQDIVCSTRIRLARNINGYPFEPKLTSDSAREIIAKLKEIFTEAEGYRFVDFEKLAPNECSSYAEKHIVSPEFASKRTPHALFENDTEQVYVMACEEDHIRAQAIIAGYDLEEAYRRVSEAERMIDSRLDIAYSERLGYLTHCPTNLGTAMRASVMMFLPLMTMRGEMGAVRNQLEKIGLTVRGMSGEGTKALGYLYQISNQTTLGITEEETLSKLADIIKPIMERERALRKSLSGEALLELEDRVNRAYGTLSYAVLISSGELIGLYSDVRLGAAMGLIDHTDLSALDKMLVLSMPSTLISNGGGKLASSPTARDKERASLVRSLLSESRSAE